jgi:hypothetical protein
MSANRSTFKTLVMLGSIGVVASAGLACFGLFSRDDSDAPPAAESCEHLTGQAKIDCEKQQQH